MPKDKIVYQENYKKGVFQEKKSAKDNFNNAKKVEILNVGKYQSGTEFITYKIYL